MDVIKVEAKRLIDRLPDNSTWDDIMYEFYVRQKIEKSLDAAKKGKTIPHEEVKKRLLNNGN
ncbi:MAG: hypothetical protein KAT34_13335 [Candidatus Aminicenantes bacterium]|nr:hypothetical protein [Candidatus Aminicenantes bacterium]